MSDAFLFRMKAAQRDLIERCGGIKRVVVLANSSNGNVGRWNNPGDPDLMPVNVIRVLEADCGVPLITGVMAEASGRRLTDPEAEREADVCVLQSHAELMRQSAELANAIAMAISDGRVSPAEAHRIDRQASELERASSNLRAALATIKALGGTQAALRIVGDEG